jgi:hypothetical protein
MKAKDYTFIRLPWSPAETLTLKLKAELDHLNDGNIKPYEVVSLACDRDVVLVLVGR